MVELVVNLYLQITKQKSSLKLSGAVFASIWFGALIANFLNVDILYYIHHEINVVRYLV